MPLSFLRNCRSRYELVEGTWVLDGFGVYGLVVFGTTGDLQEWQLDPLGLALWEHLTAWISAEGRELHQSSRNMPWNLVFWNSLAKTKTFTVNTVWLEKNAPWNRAQASNVVLYQLFGRLLPLRRKILCHTCVDKSRRHSPSPYGDHHVPGTGIPSVNNLQNPKQANVVNKCLFFGFVEMLPC